MRNRYYSTELGRFLTSDPIGVWADDVNFGNETSFVGCRPATGNDPLGLLTIVVIIGGDPEGSFWLRNFDFSLDSYTDPDGVIVISAQRDKDGNIKVGVEHIRPNPRHRQNAQKKQAEKPGQGAGGRQSLLTDDFRVIVCGHGKADGTFPDPDLAAAGVSRAKDWIKAINSIPGFGASPRITIASCWQGKVPDNPNKAKGNLAVIAANAFAIDVTADKGQTHDHGQPQNPPIDKRMVIAEPVVVHPQ